MVQPLMHDPAFLAIPSAPATADDLAIGVDLLDTLKAHAEGCVGMAANMIGVSKCIIAVADGDAYRVLYNPVIVKQAGRYDAEEGCLSLRGYPRPCVRYQTIKVQYQNEKMQTRLQTFQGWTAQIIQHEIDHCNGILI